MGIVFKTHDNTLDRVIQVYGDVLMKKLILVLSLIVLSPNYIFPQWFHQDSGTKSSLYSIDFISKDRGWIAGGGNMIKKSIDGGHSWVNYSRYTTPAYQIWYSLCFISMDDIYVCGSTYNYDRYQSNWIYSANGGINWTSQTSWGSEYSRWIDVFFLDENSGWKVRYRNGSGQCYKTSGGVDGNWLLLLTSEEILNSVFFIDEKNGWIVGGDGTIYNSTDGGENWESQNSGTTKSLRSVYFMDASNGWSVGYDNDGAVLVSTINGGETWSLSMLPDVLKLNSIYFRDLNIGWTCGSIVYEQEERGAILYTENGGETWDVQHYEDELSILYDIDFIDDNTGWVVGTDGILLKTTTGGVTNIGDESNVVIQDYSLYQNYPNPFNPSTIINYSISKRSFVQLTVFNILGQIVSKLVNQEQEPGHHEVTFDASHLPSGVYIYRLQASEYVESRKMLYLK
jgi:photosystem II stability/assembly factor-like uncharacterized protein